MMTPRISTLEGVGEGNEMRREVFQLLLLPVTMPFASEARSIRFSLVEETRRYDCKD